MKLSAKQLKALIKEELSFGDRDPDPYRQELNDITGDLETLAEQALRQHIRQSLRETYVTPGTRSAALQEEMRLNEFHGIFEQIKQYADRHEKSAFDVLDEMMALVESSDKKDVKGHKILTVGDSVKLTWVNEKVSREDVEVVSARPGEVEVRVIGESGTFRFVKSGKHWFESHDPNDPVLIEMHGDVGNYPPPEKLVQLVRDSGYALPGHVAAAYDALSKGNLGDDNSAYDAVYDFAHTRGLL